MKIDDTLTRLKSKFSGKKIRIDRDTVRKLRSERDVQTRTAAQRLLDGDSEGAKAALEWADLSDQVLSPIQMRRRICFMGFLVLVFLCLCKIHYATDILFEAETENITLTLKNEWTFEGQIPATQIVAKNITRTESVYLKTTYPEQASGQMRLTGEEIAVEQLVIPANTKIELNMQQNELNLFVRESALEGKISIGQGELILKGHAPISVDTEPTDMIDFDAESGGAPLRFAFVTDQKWHLHGLLAQELAFSEETDPGVFTSAIYSGKITILETEAVRELREGDSLKLKEIECRRLDISNGEKGIKVAFEGAASEILAGPSGFEKNMALTVPEYFRRRKTLAIFILALLSFLGKNFYLGD